MAYATLEDLEARYGELPDDMASRAEALLEDAATYLDAMVTVDPEDEQQLARLEMVSCAMVNRSLQASMSEVYGVSRADYTMGPFAQSATFSNPSGDLYLTAGEKALLGITGSYIGSMRAQVGGGDA